jgi:hypothetical protein
VAALTGLDERTAEFLTKASGGEFRSLLTADLRFLRLKQRGRVIPDRLCVRRGADRQATGAEQL